MCVLFKKTKKPHPQPGKALTETPSKTTCSFHFVFLMWGFFFSEYNWTFWISICFSSFFILSSFHSFLSATRVLANWEIDGAKPMSLTLDQTFFFKLCQRDVNILEVRLWRGQFSMGKAGWCCLSCLAERSWLSSFWQILDDYWRCRCLNDIWWHCSSQWFSWLRSCFNISF